MKYFQLKVLTAGLIAFSFSPGCNTPQEKPAEANTHDSSINAGNNEPVQSIHQTIDTLYVRAEASFFDNPFNLDENISERLSGMGFKRENEPFPNRHVEGQTDTIYHFRSVRDYFKVYKSPEKSMLMEVEIYSPDLMISNGIKTGMNTEDVLEKLSNEVTNENPGVIVVSEETMNQQLILNAANGRITSMKLKLYVD